MDTAISKKMPFRWERWLKQKLAYNKRYSWIKGFLYACSFFYLAHIKLRNWAYDVGLLNVERASLPMISVGSIVCGGTRKTPLTAHLAKVIGRPVGILTSGYAAKVQGGEKSVSIADQGDEAYLLSMKLPFAKVYANKKRMRSVRAAEREEVDYLLMDGGLQHRSLYRDIDIVTVNAKDPFAGGYYLPRGFLRDLPSRLQRADWIIVMDSENEIEYERVCDCLRKIHPDASFIGMRAALAKPEIVRNKKIGMFCGIAEPDPFIRMLQAQNSTIVCQRILSDHEPCEDVCEFVRECKNQGAEFVVCTEKDFVKLPPTECEGILPLELILDVHDGVDEYRSMLDQINAKCER